MMRVVRPIEAQFEDGLLKPTEPLPLRPGEHVSLIVVKRPDSKRRDLDRLAATPVEDFELAEVGLSEWAEQLDLDHND